MCSLHHKIHWSVVALIVNAVCLILFTAAMATPNWATKGGTNAVNTGLFQACTALNETCYDTSVFFADHKQEKYQLIASAVLNIFAVIGMWLFLALGFFFLCGLFEEKALATASIITAYASAFLALIATILFSVTIKSLDYTLSWSLALAVLGFVIDVAAGVLMCVGRNLNHKRLEKERRRKQRRMEQEIGMGVDNPGADDIEDVPLDEYNTTKKKRVWTSGASP